MSLAPITRQRTSMIVAFSRAIQSCSSPSSRVERSPMNTEMATGTPTPSVPSTTKTASATTCPPAPAAGLGDRRGGTHGEDEVLRIDRGQRDGDARRPRRRERVDGLHPPRQLRHLIAARAPAPLPDGKPEQQHAEHELEDAHPVR